MTQEKVMQLVTANRLRDGVPVYFAGAKGWSPAIGDAILAEAEAGEALLADSKAGAGPSPVISPYLVDVTAYAGNVRPKTLREQIRATGPTA